MRIGQASEHVGEPGLRVDIVEFGGGDQRVDRSSASTTTSRLTPTFSPPPTGLPMVPITIRAYAQSKLHVLLRSPFSWRGVGRVEQRARSRLGSHTERDSAHRAGLQSAQSPQPWSPAVTGITRSRNCPPTKRWMLAFRIRWSPAYKNLPEWRSNSSDIPSRVMYLELARQWRDMAEQVEALERFHSALQPGFPRSTPELR